MSIERADGTVDGRLSQLAGGGLLIDGGDLQIVKATSVRGLSSSTVPANNLRGRSTPSSGTAVAVAFGTAEPDANYYVVLTGAQDRKYWVTSKTTSGFTINTDSAWTVADLIDWVLIR